MKTKQEEENEKLKGKRRFIERLQEEKEADRLIKDYKKSPEEALDDMVKNAQDLGLYDGT